MDKHDQNLGADYATAGSDNVIKFDREKNKQ